MYKVLLCAIYAKGLLKKYFIFYLRILAILKSFTLVIIVKAMTKLNPEHSDELEIKIKEISRRACHDVLRGRGMAEMYQETNARAQPLYRS